MTPSVRRRLLRWAIVLALPLLAIGHWWYWYQPRPRAVAPESSALLGAAPGYPVRLWLPYPHQNLGALDTGAAEPREVLRAAARLADLPPPLVPRLGPFALPPAREMLVATSSDGESGTAAVRLYPVAALLARLAGLLASNPWLAGGAVEVDGRPAQVRWEGRTWWLTSGTPAAADAAGRGAAGGDADHAGSPNEASSPVLALVELATAVPPLPAGRYALRFEGEDLSFRLSGQGPAGAAAPRQPPEALLMQEPLLMQVRRRPERDEVLLLLDRDSGLLAGVPAAAAWARPDGAEDLLPAGGLLARLTGVREEALAGGALAGSDREALALARRHADAFVPLATGRSEPPIAFGLWLQVGPLARRARQLHRALEQVPLLGDEEAQRWGDVALLLEAAGGYQRAACWLAADGGAGELRLVR